jgi:hypothetical protein
MERAKMFRLDPLLLARHPHKYVQLLCRERHYRYEPGFWHHFARGLGESGVDAPVGQLLQQLRVHDPEWWSLVISANTRQTDSSMTPEDIVALQSLLAKYTRVATAEQEINA